MQVIDSANEVVDSIDREELAKFLSLKSDPEDEEAEVCIILLLPTHPHPPPSFLSFWRLIISNLISINNFFHCCLPYATLTYFKFFGE